MHAVLRAAILAAVVFVLTGCGGGSPSAAEKLYEVTGKVVRIDRDKPAVTLDHEDIPGLMKAMTMEFKAAEPTLLDGLAPGDAVQGRLKRGAGGYVLTELRKR